MRSVLVHRELPAEGGAPRGVWLPLHARGGDAASLLPLCRAAAPDLAVRAPQAARSCNALQGGGAALRGPGGAAALAGAYAGFAWWREDDDGAPEAASFADALRQAEAFLDDTRERHGSGQPLILLGHDQGADLALALALRRRETLAGVALIDAAAHPGTEEVVRALAPLPVLALEAAEPMLAAPRLRAWLRRLLRPAAAAALALGLLAAPGAARASSAGPQPGMTGAPSLGGAPAEDTCASCHKGASLNPDPGGRVALEGLPERYAPGVRYALTFRIAHDDAAVQRWGFQVTAVRGADGQGAGELVVIDPATTQRVVGPAGRQYVEHTDPGTAIGESGGTAWRFEWVAPPDDAGEVLFFGLGNAADASGSENGDRIYGPSPAPLARVAGPGE